MVMVGVGVAQRSGSAASGEASFNAPSASMRPVSTEPESSKLASDASGGSASKESEDPESGSAASRPASEDPESGLAASGPASSEGVPASESWIPRRPAQPAMTPIETRSARQTGRESTDELIRRTEWGRAWAKVSIAGSAPAAPDGVCERALANLQGTPPCGVRASSAPRTSPGPLGPRAILLDHPLRALGDAPVIP